MRWLLALIIFCAPVTSVRAAELLFDAETLTWLNQMAEPLLEAAELNPKDTSVRLIKDNSINAFVTPDRSIYVHTGLILETDSPGELFGVLAHEIGHIKGQHPARIQNDLSQQRIPILLGGLVGLGAALAGSPDAAVAALSGSSAAAQANLLYASRGYEEAADQIAFQLLAETAAPVSPLVTFLTRLQGQELLYYRQPPPYLSSHPVTPERLSAARHTMESLPAATRNLNQSQFKWLQAKVFALTHSPAETLRQYGRDETAPAELARAIAYARQGKKAAAERGLTKLLAQRPEDPYLLEFKAQLELDHGALEESAQTFAEAVARAPHDSLLRYQLGVALRHSQAYDEAIAQLQRVQADQPGWLGPYRQLGLAYGAKGDLAPSHLYLADAALRQDDFTSARQQLILAESHLDKASGRWQGYHTRLQQRLAEQEKER